MSHTLQRTSNILYHSSPTSYHHLYEYRVQEATDATFEMWNQKEGPFWTQHIQMSYILLDGQQWRPHVCSNVWNFLPSRSVCLFCWHSLRRTLGLRCKSDCILKSFQRMNTTRSPMAKEKTHKLSTKYAISMPSESYFVVLTDMMKPKS